MKIERALSQEGLTFATSASAYWMELFPQSRREKQRWQARAQEIPDATLRREALKTIAEKWGHCEGAVAFGVLVPRRNRRAFVRMVIAYELLIDYLDNVSECPAADPWANTIRLHDSAGNAVALSLSREPDYYMFNAQQDDGGFLSSLSTACRDIFQALPSSSVVAPHAERLIAMYSEAQAYCHTRQAGAAQLGPTMLVDAAAARAPELSWGEVLAGCNTSLALFPLMAEAMRPGCSEADVARCYSAYFPWTTGLHILLHSLLDRPADLAAGRFNQLEDYGSTEETAEAIGRIARRAREGLSRLPQRDTHVALLSGMVGYYLASPMIWRTENRLIADRVLEAIGPPARWATAVHRLRRRDAAKAH